MTPEQKAIELIDQLETTMEYACHTIFAKRCALVCVEELKYNARGVDVGYWDDVKEELLKL